MSIGAQAPLEHQEAWGRFARRHLSTREDRAVFHTLTDERTRAWSAREIAARERSDLDAIAEALVRFDDAGIVESAPTSTGRRYRWRPEMNYLFDELGRGAAWDPVCGMPVPANSPHVAEDLHRRTTRFCSSLCRAGFLAFRGTFSGPAPEVVRLKG